MALVHLPAWHGPAEAPCRNDSEKIGNISYKTEQHLKLEFRKLGRDASGTTLAAVVEPTYTGWKDKR